MEIKKHIAGEVGVISFLGKNLGEPADSKNFEQHLNEYIEQDIRKFVLDLNEVERINSTGLAILITAATLITDCGGHKVILSGSNDFIIGALTVTKLSQFFECYDCIDEALDRYTHAAS